MHIILELSEELTNLLSQSDELSQQQGRSILFGEERGRSKGQGMKPVPFTHEEETSTDEVNSEFEI